MEFESQEMYEFSSFNGQINWFKSNATPNCAAWNQNMTEEMMNSYNSVPNCHSDMFYHNQHMSHHNVPTLQAPPQAHLTPQQYDVYYEQHSYYQQPEDGNIDATLQPNYDSNFDYPAMQHSVESCDSMIDDQPRMIFSPPNMLAAAACQYEQMCNLNNNIDQENLPKPCFYCTVCNMKFSRLYHLKRHFESGTHKTTVKENNIEDPAESLMQFYKQPKDSQKYECQMCNKKYKNKISLKRHLTVHNGLKNVLWCQFNTRRINTETEACSSIDCSITA